MRKLYHNPDLSHSPGKPRLVRAGTRRGFVASLYSLDPAGSAVLETQVERPSRGLVRQRARAFFGGERAFE